MASSAGSSLRLPFALGGSGRALLGDVGAASFALAAFFALPFFVGVLAPSSASSSDAPGSSNSSSTSFTASPLRPRPLPFPFASTGSVSSAPLPASDRRFFSAGASSLRALAACRARATYAGAARPLRCFVAIAGLQAANVSRGISRAFVYSLCKPRFCILFHLMYDFLHQP